MIATHYTRHFCNTSFRYILKFTRTETYLQILRNIGTIMLIKIITVIDSGAPARAKRAWDRAPYSLNMVNLFSFGCHVTDRAYVRTYVRTRLQIVRVGQGKTIKSKGGVSQACLGSSFIQSFESTCDFFNCPFPLDVQNEIQLLSEVFCYPWLVCLLGFWLRNTSLVKVGNPISDGIVFVFILLNA